jgi:hypothetical protein
VPAAHGEARAGRAGLRRRRGGAEKTGAIEEIKDDELRYVDDEPGGPAMPEHPPERDAFDKTEEERRISDRGKAAAGVSDDENKEDGVESGEAVAIHPNPRANEEHRCAGGADDIGGDGAAEEEEDVRPRLRAAANGNPDAAGDDEEGADESDEGNVIVKQMTDAQRAFQDEQIIGDRDGAEGDGDLMVMPLPMVAQDEGSAGDGGEHRDERKDHQRIGVRDDLGEAALEKSGQNGPNRDRTPGYFPVKPVKIGFRV